MFYNKIEEDFVAILDKIENNRIRSFIKQGIKKNWFIYYTNNLNHESINNYTFIKTFLNNQEKLLPVFEKKIDELNMDNYDDEISSKDFFYFSLFFSIILMFSGQFYNNMYVNGEFENSEKIFFTDRFPNIKKHLLGISSINFLRTGSIFDPLMENKNNNWLINFWEIFSNQKTYTHFKKNVIDYLFRDFFFCSEPKSVSIFKENTLVNKPITHQQKNVLIFIQKIINLNLFICSFDGNYLNNLESLENTYRYNLLTNILKYLKNYKNSVFFGSLKEANKSLQSFDKYDIYEKAYIFNDLKKLSDKLLNYNLSNVKDMYENYGKKTMYDPKIEILDMIGYYATKMYETHQKKVLKTYNIYNLGFKDDLLYLDFHFTYSFEDENIYEKLLENSINNLKNNGIIINQS
ncbi:hypothetical protein [Geotoga petraea]|uniref:Uncharacterized protein n=1 Tax=Geotoga petraea TaxID=28234 RepID=A0A1G6KMR6_9BACT|nr:hypothetical protein [Geotoga petraea]SDC31626.1 hypothetical protein SAMN04488588_0797 [Geotoga petraea]